MIRTSLPAFIFRPACEMRSCKRIDHDQCSIRRWTRGNAAQHFVAGELEAHRDFAAALRFAHRFHAAANDFLAVVAGPTIIQMPTKMTSTDQERECED